MSAKHPESELTRYKALVLVGGLGTRLQSVYDEGPKAMAPVRGTPFLVYLLRGLAQAGFREAILCVGHRARQIEDWFGDGASVGLRLHYSREQELLGTGGAVRLAATHFAPGERIFAMNGDTMHPVDYVGMLRLHERSRAQCTIALAKVPDAGRYGSVELGTDGRVQKFREKVAGQGQGTINSGTYLFEPRVISQIPASGPVSLEREVLPQLLGEVVVGYPSDAFFIDIGLPDDYSRAQRELGRLEAV